MVQHIVIYLSSRGIFVRNSGHFRFFLVISHEQAVPEGLGHVELLQHGIHVANTAQVANTYVIVLGTALGTASPVVEALDDRHILDEEV